MSINKEQRKGFIEFCNLFPEVKWDRYCNGGSLEVFGWIERPDGKHDFMGLYFDNSGNCYGYMTSSARYSLEFGERIANHNGAKLLHQNCKRVEYLRLPIRSIKLRRGRTYD